MTNPAPKMVEEIAKQVVEKTVFAYDSGKVDVDFCEIVILNALKSYAAQEARLLSDKIADLEKELRKNHSVMEQVISALGWHPANNTLPDHAKSISAKLSKLQSDVKPLLEALVQMVDSAEVFEMRGDISEDDLPRYQQELKKAKQALNPFKEHNK